ncbi:hypothetical protein ACFB49_33900 [Sphingomonas sp. DBB INV C78]|uniref:hypothetical protein n=1 Tax=Sphingomonas sp. DBB INV C78 TaxID=3349434 RepID=UPI0036D377C2
MTDAFFSRMADLDAIVEQCRGEGVFAVGIVRDTSNRSDRDWPWWSIQIERSYEDGSEKRRTTAEVALNAPAPGVPSLFEGRWQARMWSGVSADNFRQQGSWPLAWDKPSPRDLNEAMAALLTEADAAIARAMSTIIQPES